jgi:hypothetical protein
MTNETRVEQLQVEALFGDRTNLKLVDGGSEEVAELAIQNFRAKYDRYKEITDGEEGTE